MVDLGGNAAGQLARPPRQKIGRLAVAEKRCLSGLQQFHLTDVERRLEAGERPVEKPRRAGEFVETAAIIDVLYDNHGCFSVRQEGHKL